MTVVFLHPIALDGGSWRFVRPDAPPGSVFPDLVGHGHRSLPARPPTLDDYARDVFDSVVGELDVVGLSLGGAVALRMALLRPGRVRSILIACSGVGGPAVREVLRDRAEDAERRGPAATAEATLQRWFTPAALADPDHRGVGYAAARLATASGVTVAAAWRALSDLDAADDLPSVAARTTVLHAAEDPTGSWESRQRMAADIPDARAVRIPGPHMVHLERPAEFASAVEDHLAWVDR